MELLYLVLYMFTFGFAFLSGRLWHSYDRADKICAWYFLAASIVCGACGVVVGVMAKTAQG